jgi:SAM-dependent methyltransferase
MELDIVREGHLGGYARGGDPATWCPRLWQWLVQRYDIRSVLDVGCGEGHSTAFFQRLGCRVMGVDGCRHALEDSVIPECVALHDFCAGPFRLQHSVDCIWCCEFLEHVDERHLPDILKTVSQATKVIAVTHAFPGQEGYHHVNCQPAGYWIDQFESLNFRCAVSSTIAARKTALQDYERVNHFARSGLVFVHNSLLSSWRNDHVQASWPTNVKALRIAAGLKLSVDYWNHWRRRHVMSRERRAAA